MDKLLIDRLPLIVAIEEASGYTWDYITANNVGEWLSLYNEEVESMNDIDKLYNELLTNK